MSGEPKTTIIVGAYGSGKTEFSINYALWLKSQGRQVGLVDLDIVNPFFRSRDLRDTLEKKGIVVVSSHEGLETADIPALSPQIYAVLDNASQDAIFDVGGDPAGARSLGRFNAHLKKRPYELWMVINPFRPDTNNLALISEMKERLERASRLQVTGLIDNTNMGVVTSSEDRRYGRRLIHEAAEAWNLPILWRTLSEDCPPEAQDDGVPVFPIKLYLRPDWLA